MFTLRPHLGVLVQPWDANAHSYQIGDLVSYQGHVYRCTLAHTSQPDWNPAQIVKENEALWQLADTPPSMAMPIDGAQPWDANAHSYQIGDLVSYQGHVYKCTLAHTSQPDWNPAQIVKEDEALWQLVK